MGHMRGSSVHFKRIASAIHAVSHASREVPPEYLLPEGMSLGTHVVIDDHGQVQKRLEHKMHLASRQAKATKDYSPMWEGVINLPEPSPDLPPARQVEIVKAWCLEYEKMTGHQVIRADVHLDEGFVDEAGKPHYNAHAHVMCDRTDDKGKVKKLTSTVLREVQNMTANVTTLQRGLDARTTNRKHIGHQNFRFDAEKNRLDLDKPKADLVRLQQLSKEWSDADLAKVKDLEAKLDGEPARLAAALAAQEEKYRLDRDALKTGTEKAKQADYQALKKAHEAEIATLKNQLKIALEKLAEAQTQASKVPKLEADAVQAQAQIAQLKPLAAQVPELAATVTSQAAEIAQLKAQIEADYKANRAAMVASKTATQADYKALKEAKDKQIADQTEAAKVPALETKITQQAEAFDKLKTDAMAVITPLRTEVKTMSNQITQLTEKNDQLAKDLAQAQRAATMANNYQADRAAGTPAHLIVPDPVPRTSQSNPLPPVPRPPEATKTASEAPKPPKAPTPSPKPEKSLVERFAASWGAMLDWIKGVGVHVAIDTGLNQSHSGPVKHLDDLHAVQHKGRGQYAVHRLADLDKVPGLDDPKTSITYRGGKGTVEGKTGPGVQR